MTQISHSTRVRRARAADAVVSMPPLGKSPRTSKPEAYLLAAALVHSLRVDLHGLPGPELPLPGRAAPRLAHVCHPTDGPLALATRPAALGGRGREPGRARGQVRRPRAAPARGGE